VPSAGPVPGGLAGSRQHGYPSATAAPIIRRCPRLRRHRPPSRASR
jgi:hypothetical protein